MASPPPLHDVCLPQAVGYTSGVLPELTAINRPDERRQFARHRGDGNDIQLAGTAQAPLDSACQPRLRAIVLFGYCTSDLYMPGATFRMLAPFSPSRPVVPR